MSQIEASRTDSAYNQMLAAKIEKSSNFDTHVITAFNGWVYDCDARLGYVDKSSKLINIAALNQKKILGASGKVDEAAKINPYSDRMKGLLVEADKQIKGASSVKGAASSGNNVIETPFEIVRRINTLAEVVGAQYRMANYNALEVVNVRNVDQLNFVGWSKNGLVEGTPEIGDYVTPQAVQQAFTAFDKALFADTFRYEFSQREKRDSAINILSEMLADIPGAMARMKDNKITSVINATSSLGDISPDWDAVTGNFYSGDAAADIETADNLLSSVGGATHVIMPKDVRRLYLRNIQSAIGGTPPNSAEPDGNRIFPLPLNDHITAVINNQITANTFTVINKPSWANFFQAPVINVSYKNSMTSGQVEGAIIFDFNGFVEVLTTSKKKYNGVT